jgi:hypothetical protein
LTVVSFFQHFPQSSYLNQVESKKTDFWKKSFDAQSDTPSRQIGSKKSLQCHHSDSWKGFFQLGKVEIDNLPGGRANITVSHPGYIPIAYYDPRSRVLLTNDKRNEVKFQLEKR